MRRNFLSNSANKNQPKRTVLKKGKETPGTSKLESTAIADKKKLPIKAFSAAVASSGKGSVFNAL